MGDSMRPITASDLMNPEVLTVRDDMTVRELAAFLIENEISGAPVADAEERLVGVVSLVDVAAVASGEGPRLARDGSAYFIDDDGKRGATTATSASCRRRRRGCGSPTS